MVLEEMEIISDVFRWGMSIGQALGWGGDRQGAFMTQSLNLRNSGLGQLN